MNIAELFVRVRADVGDVNRRFKEIERGMGGISTQARTATLSTGRLGNQFANLASQIAHVHPIVGNLAQVMGNFAAGTALTIGVLGGLAAVAVAYDVITKSARAAKKETDEFIKSLVDEAKAAYNASYAGRQLAADRAYFELEAAKKASGVGVRSIAGWFMGQTGLAGADAAALSKRLADAETGVRVTNARMAKTWDDLNPKIRTQKTATDDLKFSYNQLRNEIERTRKAVDDEGKAWWMNYAMKAAADEELTKSMAAIFAPNLDVNHVPGALKDFGTTISGVDTNIGLTKEQIKTRDELVGTLDRNTLTMKDAIWGAASQSAGIIVNALNIGGGGRGSSLGGAIGGTAGFALGFAFGGGPIGGAIGSTIGNIAGSLLGGLFDSNKKAVNTNTQALIANTAALLLNAPSVYKVARSRFDATEVKEFRRSTIRYATRGGAPVMVVP